MKRIHKTALLMAALVSFSSSSNAAITFDVLQFGSGELRVNVSGSIDLGTATVLDTLPHQIQFNPLSGIISSGAIGNNIDLYAVTITPLAGFGSAPTSLGSITSSLSSSVFFSVVGGRLGLPEGYVSNTFLLGETRFSNTSIADSGATPGTHVWQVSIPQDGGGTIEETVTINVVPEPSSLLLAGLGASMLVGRRRRQ